VLESLASGVPAVVAAKGGPKGIVRHGETGYHAEPKNINDFYEKIICLVDDDDLRSYMGKNGRKYASTQSWKKLTAKLFADYEAINISETVEI
jgi:glycosyltransferase involved in cell wall biosynthesis